MKREIKDISERLRNVEEKGGEWINELYISCLICFKASLYRIVLIEWTMFSNITHVLCTGSLFGVLHFPCHLFLTIFSTTYTRLKLYVVSLKKNQNSKSSLFNWHVGNASVSCL
jgi:hypothetical protein